jgi:hypothetical protein
VKEGILRAAFLAEALENYQPGLTLGALAQQLQAAVEAVAIRYQ